MRRDCIYERGAEWDERGIFREKVKLLEIKTVVEDKIEETSKKRETIMTPRKWWKTGNLIVLDCAESSIIWKWWLLSFSF